MSSLISFRLPEGEADSKAEILEEEKRCTAELYRLTAGKQIDTNNISLTRLGKKAPEREDGKPQERPLRVTFNTKEANTSMMTNLYKLKNAPDLYKNLRIKHDMTIEERVADKALQEDANRRNTEEDKPQDFIFVVRGQPWNRKIVRIRRYQEKEQETNTSQTGAER